MRVRSGSEIYLENHGCIRIKNGSTLLLEENSSLRLADSALIVIDSTGTLEMRSNHITLAGPDARIVVKPGGTIKTADGVYFTFSGSGYLELHEHAQIDLGQDSRFQLYGQGEDKRMLVLKEDADINIGSHHMVLKRGKILSHTNSKLSLSDSTLYIHKCTFSNAVDGVQGGTGIEGTALARARVAQSNFIGLEKAVALLNADSTTGNTYNIVGCEFLDNDYSVWLKDNKRKVSILGSDITSSDQGHMGIYAENAPLLEYYGGKIDNAYYGMELKNVRALYLQGATIDGCISGIKADTSNLFIRNNSTIQNCTTGIEFYGATGDGNLITVGDINCGNIINCEEGITGSNAVLKIDAILNACARGDCNDVAPNRFDGNVEFFNICYMDTIVDTVFGRSNYWGLDGSGNGMAPDNSDYSLTNSYPNKPCDQDIPIRAGGYLDTIPDDCSNGGSITVGTLNDAELYQGALCTANLSVGTGRYMSEDFLTGYRHFLDTNWTSAKTLLEDVASENIEADTFAPGCEQCVKISRVLVDVIKAHEHFDTLHSSGTGKTDWASPELKEEKTIDGSFFQLYPNPAEGTVTVVFTEGNTADMVLVDLSGTEILRQSVQQGETIDLQEIPAGIYLVKLLGPSGNPLGTQRLVVQK